MDEFKTIYDVKDYLHNLIPKVLFRGQADFNWDLIPKIGRKDYYFTNEKDELASFRDCIQMAFQSSNDETLESSKEYFKEFGFDDLSLLSLAQHYEVFPTRFLDWTDNALISIYFGCRELMNKDGCVWVFEAPDNFSPHWLLECDKKADLFLFNKLKIYIVPRFCDEIRFEIEGKSFGNRRPENQRSIMTIHPKKDDGSFCDLRDLLGKGQLKSIKISAEKKNYFIKTLEDEYCINKDSVLNGKPIQDIKNQRIWEGIIQKFISNNGKRSRKEHLAGS